MAGALFAPHGQRGDFPDERRPQRPGQVVTHAGESHEPGVRDSPGDRQAPARRDQRVMQPVDNQCGDGDPTQRRGAVRLAHARRELPPGAVRIIAPVPAPAGQVTHILLVEREAGRADEPERLDGRGNGRGPADGHPPPEHPGVDPGFRLSHPARSGGGHHQREGADPGGVLQRDGLRDEPAHRRPDQVHLSQPKAVEEPGHVRGHVADRVRRRPAPYEDVGQARGREVPQVGRFADVPVVEPDDEQAAPGQALAQLVRPGDHLGRQAHDQHDRRRARVAERLIRQLDAVGGDPAQCARGDIIHARSFARRQLIGNIRARGDWLAGVIVRGRSGYLWLDGFWQSPKAA
jgi:hypothetical protein